MRFNISKRMRALRMISWFYHGRKYAFIPAPDSIGYSSPIWRLVKPI